ncbi:MAG: histidinol-phosphatase [Cyclobacteriaceae bacterium]|jgi:histidinol-phosphatase (PHP family)
MWANYHTHSQYCDGREKPETYLAEAQQQGLIALGFSSHAPLPFARPWCMASDSFAGYITHMATLKENADIEIACGLEVDFIPGLIGPHHFQHQLDYTIGSVHFVDRLPDGDHWEIDSTRETFERGLREIFANDTKEAISRYFELIREMVNQSPPDVVGHLDKIKMHNKGDRFFQESDRWYRDQVDLTLQAVKRQGCILEVNTRGWYLGKTDSLYPSPWVAQRALEMQIPICLSSDAHRPDELTKGFDDAAAELFRLGCRKTKIWLGGQWQFISFSPDGLRIR